MTSYERDVRGALADAASWALASREDTSPDPDAVVRAEIDVLSRSAPSLPAAVGLLGFGIPVAAVDRESLAPTSGPLGTLGEVADHWRARPGDGVGVVAGSGASRTVFAVAGPRATVRAWLAEHGSVRRDVFDSNGRVTGSEPSWMPAPPFVQVGWSPPPPAPAQTASGFGAAADYLPASLRTDRRDQASWDAVTAYLCWSVPVTHGQGLRVRSRRRLGDNVSLLGEGSVVPWSVRRPNGWTLSASGPPRDADDPVPDWLLDAVRGVWTKAVR